MRSIRYSFLVISVFPLISLCSFKLAQVPGKVRGHEIALATQEQKEQLSQGYSCIFNITEQLKQQIDQYQINDPDRARKLRRLLGILEDMLKDRKHPTVMMQAVIDFIDSEFSEEVARHVDAAESH